jgi:hypothetical protein
LLLTIKERIALLNILPSEGNLRTIKTVSKLREALYLSEAEVKEFEFKAEGNQFRWNAAKDTGAEIEIGDLGTEIIVDGLQDLDKSKKLTFEHMSVWDKFVTDEK